MAGRTANPLRIKDGDPRQWDKEQVVELVLPRLNTMPLTEALAMGFKDEEGRQWGLPATSTFNEWLVDNPQWAVRRARAQQARAEALAEEALQITDAEPERRPDGSIDPAAIRRAESRANQRKWMASKLDRNTYGEQVQVDMQLHASIDIRGVLAEARGRVIEARGRVIEGKAECGEEIPADALDMFD
jgi:hypothetical protein